MRAFADCGDRDPGSCRAMTDIHDALQALNTLAVPPGATVTESVDPQTAQLVQDSQSWMFGPTVIGWGASTKVVGGQATDTSALKLYVEQKISSSDIPADQQIPAQITLPATGAVVDVDVEEIGTQYPQSNIGPVRPCPPGYSIGLLGDEGNGTLGCLVRDATGRLLLLSNSHVIADSGNAAIGSTVIQPGPGDGGGANQAIATLAAFVPLDFTPGFNNQVDAAVALITDPSLVTALIPGIGVPTTPPSAFPAQVGDQIQIVGRSSGTSTGKIKDLNYMSKLSYPTADGSSGLAYFRDQVLCERYAIPGDSGSVVCDMNGVALGLHYCGSDITSTFCLMSNVLALLNITLDGTPPATAADCQRALDENGIALLQIDGVSGLGIADAVAPEFGQSVVVIYTSRENVSGVPSTLTVTRNGVQVTVDVRTEVQGTPVLQ
jgi:hypothetical protein